jgi:hypothetical protein
MNYWHNIWNALLGRCRTTANSTNIMPSHIREEQIREEFPAVKAAWEEYQTLLVLHDDGIDRNPNIYIRAGEDIYCEKGHYICQFRETVLRGQMQNSNCQTHLWSQPKPEYGTPINDPSCKCAICGSLFTTGYKWHLKDGWR